MPVTNKLITNKVVTFNIFGKMGGGEKESEDFIAYLVRK